jgi:hypothetical protein
MPKKYLSVLGALFIGAYFIVLTKDAVLSYFSPDDCMNIYRSWANSAAALVKANLLFFLNSPFYRPMGSVWYRSMFELAGFNPVPFHIANLCTLAANMWFTYCVARRLSDSKTVGAVAALLIAYHGRFINLYFDTGYTFDVVCYFFYFAALAFYLRIRSRPRPPKWWEMVVLAVLYICALNAKEMAVTLPLFLAAYEWLYHPDLIGGLRNMFQWSITYGRCVLLAGLLAFAFVAGRMTSGTGLIGMSAFKPVFTWRRFMETSVNFVSPLFFRNDMLPSAVVLAIWLGLFVTAWAMKSRALKFAWLFLMLSVLPVAFIPPRGPGQYYITYFGWVLYAAVLLFEAAKRLFVKLPNVVRFARARDALLILCVAAVMYAVNRSYTWSDVDAVAREGEELRAIAAQIHKLRPALRKGARVVFLDDPIEDPWRMMFLMRMSYRDNDLVIDNVRHMGRPFAQSEIASYDYVFDYLHGRFFTSPQPRPQGPQPEIVYEAGYPAVFHTDWTRVTPRAPAKPGETLISMVQDLGDTTPAVPHDKPYPSDPLVEVAAPFEVRVDGQPVEVLTKIGWPNHINRYRVDFRIPNNAKPGEPQVVISSGPNTGLSTPILVR